MAVSPAIAAAVTSGDCGTNSDPIAVDDCPAGGEPEPGEAGDCPCPDEEGLPLDGGDEPGDPCPGEAPSLGDEPSPGELPDDSEGAPEEGSLPCELPELWLGSLLEPAGDSEGEPDA